MNRKKLYTELNKSMLQLFGDRLWKIILYGSYARNKQNRESDIDFLVLVDDTEENLRGKKYQIADTMTTLSLNNDVLVSITEESCMNFELYSDIIPFYKNIREQGIEIYGRKNS